MKTSLLTAERLREIYVDRRVKYLGCFRTAEAAHARYVEAKRALHPGSTL